MLIVLLGICFSKPKPGANAQTTNGAVRERPVTAPSGRPRRARQGAERRQAPPPPPPSAAAGHGDPAGAQGETAAWQPKRERGVSARAVEARLDELRADEDVRCETSAVVAAAAVAILYRWFGGIVLIRPRYVRLPAFVQVCPVSWETKFVRILFSVKGKPSSNFL